MLRIKIYKITNKLNNMSYIGITSRTLEYRWNMHIQPASQCKYLHNAIMKYGKKNFTIEEVFTCFDYDAANEMESHFITLYNTMVPNGYNLREGGKYGKMSEGSKEKNRESQYIRWSDPKEQNRASKLMKGRHKKEDLMSGIREYVQQKKRKVIGIHIKNHNIIKFDTVLLAQIEYPSICGCLNSTVKVCKKYCWFYDEDQTLEQLIQLKDEILKNKKSNWKELPTRQKRVDNMRKASTHRFKAIVAVNIDTFDVINFENVHDAMRQKFSASSIYGSINGKSLACKKHCFFYKTEQNDEFYINQTKERIKNHVRKKSGPKSKASI